jgi:signal transduction histidine kinase
LSNRKLIALGTLSFGLCATSAAVALANTAAEHRDAYAVIAALTVAALLGVGLYAWQREGEGRFGQVLFATGLCWFLASLSNSDADILYSVGRVAAWVFEVALVYALLSYPSGRLETRAARLLVAAAALVVTALYLPTIPFVEQYPLPTPFTSCTTGCPPNSFFLGFEPGFVATVVKPLREALTIAVYLAVVALLSVRLREASRSLRRTLVPVLGAAVLRFMAAGLYIALRRAEVDADALYVASLVTLLSIPATALGFFVGLLQWQIYSGTALARLNTGLAGSGDPAELRALLARSLEEPEAELYLSPPVRGGASERNWLDSSGRDCLAPGASAEGCLAEAEAESGLRVAILCDRGFRDHPDFLQAVAFCVIAGLERQRLDLALAASAEDVVASRKRLAGAADGARRKIERDLHDGAQQHLVALRVKLELAREALERNPDATEVVADLGPEVDEIIEEVRSLARGIYPALLASDGLGEALRAAGRRSPLPVSVSAEGIGRFPPETESAVYFCCLEALQNAAKHASGASRVGIELRLDGDLLFEVSDDGCGFAVHPGEEGSGITGMRDRLAAVGGELRIESAPGAGARALGRISLN